MARNRQVDKESSQYENETVPHHQLASVEGPLVRFRER